uniref:(northern house mosquito) hypothetical protein n=1 Tax=Culex pipiens TaxID=7175 RepID=A0A8D8BI69_CULPI
MCFLRHRCLFQSRWIMVSNEISSMTWARWSRSWSRMGRCFTSAFSMKRVNLNSLWRNFQRQVPVTTEKAKKGIGSIMTSCHCCKTWPVVRPRTVRSSVDIAQRNSKLR